MVPTNWRFSTESLANGGDCHARRKFVEIERQWPVESRFAVGSYQRLYEIERAGKQPGGADLGQQRSTQSMPILDGLFTWAREQSLHQDVLLSSGLAKALVYRLKHEAGLRGYLDDPAVPIDNNESDRVFRSTVRMCTPSCRPLWNVPNVVRYCR
jgi:hypothetical protein